MNNIVKRIDQTTIFTQPILFVLITTLNTLNIIILRSPTLRYSSCSYYFLSYSIFSLINICCLCPTQILRHFSIISFHSKIGCQIQDFLFFSLAIEMKSMLTLVSFDRFCSTTKSVRWRSFSRISLAKKAILLISLLTIIAMSPMLFTQHYNSKSNRCEQNQNRWNKIYSVGQVVFYQILIPSLLILFGMLTISNIRRKSFGTSKNRTRPNEKHLTRILILQVFTHLIYTIPFGISHLLRSFGSSMNSTMILAINQASILWLQCEYFTFFFLYILSARTYRRELFRLLKLNSIQNRSIRSKSRLSRSQQFNELRETQI